MPLGCRVTSRVTSPRKRRVTCTPVSHSAPAQRAARQGAASRARRERAGARDRAQRGAVLRGARRNARGLPEGLGRLARRGRALRGMLQPPGRRGRRRAGGERRRRPRCGSRAGARAPCREEKATRSANEARRAPALHPCCTWPISGRRSASSDHATLQTLTPWGCIHGHAAGEPSMRCGATAFRACVARRARQGTCHVVVGVWLHRAPATCHLRMRSLRKACAS